MYPFENLAEELKKQCRTITFFGVNVIPMDSDRILYEQIVIVEDGRISAIGPLHETDVPTGSLYVMGSGKYLLPGLVDLQAHVITSTDLFLFLSHGITSINIVDKDSILLNPEWKDLRKNVEQQDRLGPAVFFSDLLADNTDTGSQSAGESIHQKLDQGVRNGLTPFQNLRKVTVEAAINLGQKDVGSIIVGNKADLVLLDANPLEDIANLNRLIAVVFRGTFLSSMRMQEILRNHFGTNFSQ